MDICNMHFGKSPKRSSSLPSGKEEIKISAKLFGMDNLGTAAGCMVFDNSMPEFNELK